MVDDVALLFVVAVIGVQFVRWPLWIELPLLAAFLMLAAVRPPRAQAEPLQVAAPLVGTWVGLNSPADRVPSHGTHTNGQTYAIDVAQPSPPGTSSKLPWTPISRAPQEFSSFGAPVYAVAAGTVATAFGAARDHRSRTSWPAIGYLLVVESFVRSLGGQWDLFGNYVVLEHGDGAFSAYAHLRRGSLLVEVGERVPAGRQLAEVGNSGNSSEPHLHFQLMDRARAAEAAGLPFRGPGIEIRPGDTDPTRSVKPVTPEIEPGLPAAGQVFRAGDDPPS